MKGFQLIKTLCKTLLVLGTASLLIAGLALPNGFTVHVPATTATLVISNAPVGTVRAVTQLSVLNLPSGVPCFFSSASTMNSNGTALFNGAVVTIDQDDKNPYYFWSTNAFDVAGNGWPRN